MKDTVKFRTLLHGIRSVSDLPTYIRGYFTDHFAWRQQSQISPLFQFSLGRGPNVLLQYIAGIASFLFTIFLVLDSFNLVMLSCYHL
jgi:hypothetical protein